MTPKETIVVPAEVVVDLRTGLYAQIGMAAELLESLTLKPDREDHPQRYRKPLQDLDRVRALLDAIGWRQPGRPVSVELDLCEHHWALLAGLRTILKAIDGLGSDKIGTAPPSTENAVCERARAIRALLRRVRAHGRA